MTNILICGDFCMHNRMHSYNSKEIVNSMSDIIPLVQQSDYSILNMECAVSDRQLSPINKCGIHLQNSSETIKAIKDLGFNAVTLANNHFADFGSEGVSDSIEILDRYEIDHVGGGNNIDEAQRILYKTINNINIALINCCEHEFTIASRNTGGGNPLNIIDLTNSIREAKANSDYVIIIIHGGSEHYNLPTPRMQKTYRFFIEQGADAVINHHQHCYSGYEYHNNRPIVYGLGNFCFDYENCRNSPWNEGYMAILSLDQDNISISPIPYIQCNDTPGIKLLSNTDDFIINISKLNQIISNPDAVIEKYNEFIATKRDEYLYLYHLPQNKTIRRLSRKNLLPKKLQQELLPVFLEQERATNLLSFFQCESHRDLMIPILEKLTNNK